MAQQLNLRPDFAAALGRAIDFDAWLAWSGEAFRDVAGRRTLRFVVAGRGYFIKIHSGVGWREILKNLLSLRLPVLGADNERRAIERLHELDVPTMTIAGFGQRGINPARQQSFLITDELTDTVSLEDLCRDWPQQAPALAFKRALIRQVANMARCLHGNGLNHRDFYLCHFLWDRHSPIDAPRLYLIDLHRVQIRPRVPYRWLVKDLGALWFSAMEIGLSQRDLWRFLRAYYQQPLRVILTEYAALWRDVKNRAEALYRSYDP